MSVAEDPGQKIINKVIIRDDDEKKNFLNAWTVKVDSKVIYYITFHPPTQFFFNVHVFKLRNKF